MDGRGWQQADFDRLGALTASDFDALVGTEVPLVDLDGRSLVVVDVDRLASGARPADGREGDRPFDVLLDGAADTALQQGMHAVDLPGHGVVPLFLVPLSASEEGRRYVASFG